MAQHIGGGEGAAAADVAHCAPAEANGGPNSAPSVVVALAVTVQPAGNAAPGAADGTDGTHDDDDDVDDGGNRSSFGVPAGGESRSNQGGGARDVPRDCLTASGQPRPRRNVRSGAAKKGQDEPLVSSGFPVVCVSACEPAVCLHAFLRVYLMCCVCVCVGGLCKMCVFLEGIRIDPGKCYYFFPARLAKSGEPLGMGWKSVTSSSTLQHSKKKERKQFYLWYEIAG